MVSQPTGYAILALIHLSRGGRKLLLIKELADQTRIPVAYLAKIINTLARKRLVATQRGLGGGVTITASAERSTLHAICEALDDPVLHRRCVLGQASCDHATACAAHRFWGGFHDEFLSYLQATTIADLAAEPSPKLPARLAQRASAPQFAV